MVTVEQINGTSEYKVTDCHGEVSYTTEYGLESQFVEVKKADHSFSLEEIAARYASMMQLNQEEDEHYIKGTEELSLNRYK